MGVDRIAGLKDLRNVKLYVRARTNEVGLKIAGHGVVMLTGGAVAALIKGFIYVAKRWPAAILLVMLVVAAVFLLTERGRRAITAGVDGLCEHLAFMCDFVVTTLKSAEEVGTLAGVHRKAISAFPSIAAASQK